MLNQITPCFYRQLYAIYPPIGLILLEHLALGHAPFQCQVQTLSVMTRDNSNNTKGNKRYGSVLRRTDALVMVTAYATACAHAAMGSCTHDSNSTYTVNSNSKCSSHINKSAAATPAECSNHISRMQQHMRCGINNDMCNSNPKSQHATVVHAKQMHT